MHYYMFLLQKSELLFGRIIVFVYLCSNKQHEHEDNNPDIDYFWL